ncbi:MAG: tetratricopeptide repeat protein [Elusimicrobia bacterium]|nr:tetratricopeptide repeat protein [Elusimicrobiota bacterium]
MSRRLFSPPILVALAAIAAFLPSLGNGFVNLDDGWYLLTNPHFKGWTLENIKWMFTPWPRGGHYAPLTWMSFGLDWSLWGMRPMGYHLTSNLLHAGGAVAFYFVGLRLFEDARTPKPDAAAFLAALLFAVHPLRVESVAWASERRDVLSGLLYLLTIHFYLRRRLAASLACYAASLLSKSMGMTLPFALILLDFYPLARLPASPRGWVRPPERAVWLEKLPFLALAAAIAAVTVKLQVASGAAWPVEKLSAVWRVGVACYGLMFYLAKTALPLGLVPLYPMPSRIEDMAPVLALSILGGVCATALCALRAKRSPALLTVWAFYAVSLAPVSGLAQIGPQIAADRYSYIPCLGWALLLGWGVSRLPRNGAWAAGGLWILLLAGLTWRQTGIWRDSETLWTATAASYPRHAPSRLFLGNIMDGQGRADEARGYYLEALSLEPGYGAAHNNLANLLVRLDRGEEALGHYEAALRASPGHQAVHYNWGVALLRLGRRGEAAEHFRQELGLAPDHEPSLRGLEAALRDTRGRTSSQEKENRGKRGFPR